MLSDQGPYRILFPSSSGTLYPSTVSFLLICANCSALTRPKDQLCRTSQ